jgi:glycosyltransferase involved in cell wall biosynthesis
MVSVLKQAPPMRILVASHSHPAVSNGGAEIAAFQLFRALQASADCRAWFLGCDPTAAAERGGAVLTQPYSGDEYVYATGAFDWFKFSNPDPRLRAELERLVDELAPDVIHFHHYINLGLEALLYVRQARPHCKIVLTLHEYLAICHHFGQMVTRQHHNLCHQSSPALCQRCFPDIPRSDFFLRKRYIERFFDLVDVFVAPSAFLAARYIAWGLPAQKVVVLENLMPPATLPVAPLQVPQDGALRFGFFGQISGLKGIDVVFDAAATLQKQGVTAVNIDVFGDYRGQPPDFQAAFLRRLDTAGLNIRFHGPYDRDQVDRLMQSVHAVLAPSVWWENSPVVIQEALRNRRPVICSDIGGMAEKVRDGIDGIHFPAGNALALAALLHRLVENRAELAALADRMSGTPSPDAGADAFIRLYRRAGGGRDSVATPLRRGKRYASSGA